MLMIAVAVGTSVGMNSLISRRLGERRFNEANSAASNGLFLELLSALLFLVIGLTLIGPFLRLFTDNNEVYSLALSYLRICTVFGAGIFLQCGGERILQSMGKTKLSMIAQLAGAVTNIVLDPLLIFGYHGFPQMGIAGAALATVIGQWVGMAICMLLIFKGKHEVKVSFRKFRPNTVAIREIYRVGLPSIIMQSIGAVMNSGMNLVLSGLISNGLLLGVPVMNVYFKMQSIIFMPMFGITNASMSIIAYNYGARDYKRLKATWLRTLQVCVLVMLFGLICFQLFPSQIVSIFDSKGELAGAGLAAFRIIPLHFPVAAFCITASVLFQAVGRGFYSMIISLLRQLVALLPAAAVLALATNSINAVWWAFPIAEIVSLITSSFFLLKLFKTDIANIRFSEKQAPLTGEV